MPMQQDPNSDIIVINPDRSDSLTPNRHSWDGTRKAEGSYRVDVSRGRHSGELSSEWWRRPNDQRFENLRAMRDHLYDAWINSQEADVRSSDIRFIGSLENPEALSLLVADMPEARMTMTHNAFQQMCDRAKGPSGYLRTLPGFIVAQALTWGMKTREVEQVKLFWNKARADSVQLVQPQLKAATGPKYGRIPDFQVLDAIINFAGDGTGDTMWKIPGQIDWITGHYNPYVPITKASTSLFASDRDMTGFLCADAYPIEVGKLPSGEPDLLFRGFFWRHSETGNAPLEITTMYLRGVCMNRNFWGIEGSQTLYIRHSSQAPERFVKECEPALLEFAKHDPMNVLKGIQVAKDLVVARTDEDRKKFLSERGMSKALAASILECVEQEEGRPAESIWDFCNGMTAAARRLPHEDARLDLEKLSGRLFDKAVGKAA